MKSFQTYKVVNADTGGVLNSVKSVPGETGKDSPEQISMKRLAVAEEKMSGWLETYYRGRTLKIVAEDAWA